jgi:hypothetical protein
MITMIQKIRSAVGMAALIVLAAAATVNAQTYTLAPAPYQTFLSNAGVIVNNGCIWTYLAGTTTNATTYSDTAGTPNLDPIRSDAAGRFTAYLVVGTNYKFVYESTCTPPSTHGTVVRTQDNILAIPGASATVDISGTAGEALTLGQCAYLSDGSGGKTVGLWYKCDAANTYSSIAPEIGLVVNSIAIGNVGLLRQQGGVSGLSSLSVGAKYFLGTAGALTTTAPTFARLVGQADTATSLVVSANPPLAAVAMLQGKGTLWVPAVAMSPTVTNGVTGPTIAELTAGNPNITTLSFVNGAQKNAQFAVAFPKSWNAGTVTYQAYWTGTAAGAGTTIWGLQCLGVANGVTLDTAFGTAIEVTSTFSAVKQVHVAAESAALTITGAAADTLTTCQVYRKGGTDTRAAPSLLLGIKFYYTTNAANDQ